jgi:hypothetical protein
MQRIGGASKTWCELTCNFEGKTAVARKRRS